MGRIMPVAVVGSLAALTLGLPTIAQASVVGPSATKTDSQLAGYTVGNAVVKRASARWTVQPVSCGATNSYSDFQVGVEVPNSSRDFRVGTAADCRHGVPRYYAYTSTSANGRDFVNEPVAAGDVIEARSLVRPGHFRQILINRTQAWRYDRTNEEQGSAIGNQAEFVVRAGLDDDPQQSLADFGSVTFSHAAVNGEPITTLDPQPVTMRSPGGPVRARPGALSDDGRFTVVWKHE